MANGSSKYSSQHYDYRPFTGPVIPTPSQMTHGDSYASGSTLPSYDMPRRRKRKWYRFGTVTEAQTFDTTPTLVLPKDNNPPLRTHLVSSRFFHSIEPISDPYIRSGSACPTHNSGFPETSRSSADPFDASAGHGAIRKPSYS